MERKSEYVDIRTGQTNNSSIIMKDGKIQEIRSGFNQGGPYSTVLYTHWKNSECKWTHIVQSYVVKGSAVQVYMPIFCE